MRTRSLLSVGIVLALAVFLLAPGRASAYVGPGAGLELVGYSLSLLGWVGFAFSALLLYPVYSFLAWLRCNKGQPTAPASLPEAESPREEVSVGP